MEQLDFKISSNLKNIIGKELITDDLIAIFELVKNSYDAYASCVKIIFENIKDENSEDKARIIIIDNGNGMSKKDIEDKWLFVGYSEKKEFEDLEITQSSNFRDKIQEKRTYAGAKGIGRFSCDRLGSQLKIITKTKNENFFNCLSIDWSKFEKDSRELFQTIKVDYEASNKIDEDFLSHFKNFQNGTILEITYLNRNWDRKKLQNLKKYLQRLVNPADENNESTFQLYLSASEFLDEDSREKSEINKINGQIYNFVFERLKILTTQVSCNISANGDKIITRLDDKDEYIFTIEEKNQYPLLKDINVKLFYLNPGAKRSFTRLMGITPNNYGSIFLYKNIFRVHPYGNEGDDWLGLEARKGQGYARYLASRELIGRIEIRGYQPSFVEVSSRSGGLIDTPAFEQLKEFFKEKALRRLERFVVEVIGWDKDENIIDPATKKSESIKLIKNLAGQLKDPDFKIDYNENLLDIVEEKKVEKIPEIIKNLEQIKKSVQNQGEVEYIDKQIKGLNQSFRKVNQEIKEKEAEIKKKIEDLNEKSIQLTVTTINLSEKEKEVENLKSEVKQIESENIFLKSVAGEDKTEIISLQHQIGISTDIIQSNIKLIKNRILNEESISKKNLTKYIERIDLEAKKITRVVSFVTKAQFVLDRDTVTLDLPQFIKQYLENVYVDILEAKDNPNNAKIIVNLENGLSNFKCKIKPLEFAILIDNIISNALKAESKNIIIDVLKNGDDGLYLIFKNDGLNIEENNLNRIFEFGFSTRKGSGIGLYHVKDIVEKMNGKVEVKNLDPKGVEFIVNLPNLR